MKGSTFHKKRPISATAPTAAADEGGSKRIPLGEVEFLLEPDARRVPVSARDPMEDHFYQGTVSVLRCASRPQLEGKSISMNNSRMLSCAPYFHYVAGDAQLEMRGRDRLVLIVTSKARHTTRPTHLKPLLCAADLHHMVDEQHLPAPLLVHQAHALIKEKANDYSVSSTVWMAQPQAAPLRQHGDAATLHARTALVDYFVPNKQDVKQHRRLRSLSCAQLDALLHLLATEPWELVWCEPLYSSYNALKPLSRESYERALRANPSVTSKMHEAMRIALQIYFVCCESRAQDKHTLFFRDTFNSNLPCMPRNEREQLERAVFVDILGHRAVRWVAGGFAVVPRECFALHKDYQQAQTAARCLRHIHQNSKIMAEPELRGCAVPQLFPPLTQRQAEFADYARTHWLTLVQGAPGTGKTALITWVLSHWRNVCITGFVGMLVKMIRKRNGRRVEVAHTIHHLLAVAENAGPADQPVARWFASFEVLVVDEFSNVSMSLFSKLLMLFPRVSKIILVGDHEQLKPIDCGDPMGDMLSAFGAYAGKRLTENLRVVPELRALQLAPSLIIAQRVHDIPWSRDDGASLCMATRQLSSSASSSFTADRTCALLVAEFRRHMRISSSTHARRHSILDTHIVTLVNDGPAGRHAINAAAEAAWIQLGKLQPPAGGGIEIRKGLRLYAGCKITFTQNYNRLIEKQIGKTLCRSDPISNGEIVLVVSVCRHESAHGFRLVVVDSENDDDDPETKTVWIDAELGVHPMHVEMGYASTTYKSQGREFPFVIFWCPDEPTPHWTRSHPYVALSRGKQRVLVCVDRPESFNRLCARADTKRRTVFEQLLKLELDCTEDCACPIAHYEPAPRVPHDTLTLDDDTSVPCVPVVVYQTQKSEDE